MHLLHTTYSSMQAFRGRGGNYCPWFWIRGQELSTFKQYRCVWKYVTSTVCFWIVQRLQAPEFLSTSRSIIKPNIEKYYLLYLCDFTYRGGRIFYTWLNYWADLYVEEVDFLYIWPVERLTDKNSGTWAKTTKPLRLV